MTNFTKEELVSIWRCVNPVIVGDKAHALSEKLKSMIENYCEQHESDEFENPDFCKHCDARFR